MRAEIQTLPARCAARSPENPGAKPHPPSDSGEAETALAPVCPWQPAARWSPEIAARSPPSLEPLDVRDDLMRLNAKAKMRRRILQPVLNSRFFNQLPESEIHFNGIELRCVVTQEFLLRQLWRIEIRLPCRVSPSGGSSKELRHRVLARISEALLGGRERPPRKGTRHKKSGLYLASLLLPRALPCRLSLRDCLLRRPMILLGLAGDLSSLRFLRHRSRHPFQIRQPLLQCKHGFKQIAQFLEARHHLRRLEHQQARIFFLACALNLLPFTGVETVGCSRARSEYTATVVLCSSFWLQSTKHFAGAEILLHIGDDQIPGCSCSSNCASACANVLVAS